MLTIILGGAFQYEFKVIHTDKLEDLEQALNTYGLQGCTISKYVETIEASVPMIVGMILSSAFIKT